ncbi:putative guanylate cyclase activating protein [Plasmopara halstedii]
MLGVLAFTLLSVCVSLSLCVVPVLARYTIFPLLTSLVHKLTAIYLTDSMRVEYAFGSFTVRGQRGGGGTSEMLRGITISLFFVQLQSEFLKTLAFAKQGLAPVDLKNVSIKEVVIQLATTWKVVVKVEGVVVDGTVVDPNVEGCFGLQDAVTMKLNEAAYWINMLTTERASSELRQKQEQDFANARSTTFSFKDRVLQQIASQVDVHVRNVRISLTGLTPGNAAIDGHDDEAEKDDEMADRATTSSIAVRLNPTRVSFSMKSLDLLTDVLHENNQEALQLILTSNTILVEYALTLKGMNICASTIKDEEEGVTAAVEKKQSLLKDSSGVQSCEQALVSISALSLNVRVPPMPRLLGIVASIAPIPMKHRLAQVEIASSSVNTISVVREPLVGVLRDIYVPYTNHQVLVQSMRMLEQNESVCKHISREDETFYLANYDKVNGNKSLSTQEKENLNEKLSKLELSMTLNKILKLRSRATGLAKFYRCNQDELSLGDYTAVVQENAAKPSNIMFRVMHIALRWDNMSVNFGERDHQVAEMVVIGFGVNVRMFPVADGKEKLKLDVDLMLNQTTFAVFVGTSELSPLSPTAKLLFADFCKVAAESDGITPPQMLTAHMSQYERGEMDVRAVVNNVNLVLFANALEHFLLYVDRLTTKATQVLSTARPPITPVVHTESTPAMVQVMKNELDAMVKEVSMSPFSLLGGMLLNLDVGLNDCRILLLPTQSFTKLLFTDVNVETSQSEYVVNCRVDLPVTLSIHLESSKVKEIVKFQVSNLSVGAQYVEEVRDMETVLAPTSIAFQFVLEQDAKNPLTCHQTVMIHMPDILVAGSDLSLSLLASCGEALASVQTTTPDQARLRLESRIKQEEIRRQAEVNTILDRLHRLFDEIDENGNGRIELAELLLLLRRVKVGDTLLESELEYFVCELFKEIDQDGNGYLEFQELREFLRDDLLSGEAAAAELTSKSGSSALTGFLNLRGNEYHSFEVINNMCETKITSTEQLAEWIKRPVFECRFWELFGSEAHVTNRSLGDQNPVDVQKKLVRLLKNYDAANLIWDAFVLPAIQDGCTDRVMFEWLLKPSTRCGGISEYQSAAKVIAKQKRDVIFKEALEEVEQLVSKFTQDVNPVKKELQFTTDVKMGNLRFVLTDTELPARFFRGDLIVKDVKFSMKLNGKDIDEIGPIDWVSLTTSGNSAWTILCGFKMSSSCFSDMANDMEHIIEPWDLVVGISSEAGENGCSVLIEAAKRFQINVTPSVLKTYRALMDALDGEAQQNALQKRQDSIQCSTAAKRHKENDCLVQNLTGCKIILQLNGIDHPIEVEAHDRALIENGALKYGKATLNSLSIDQWGTSKTAVNLPAFGKVSVGVSTAKASPSTLFITVFSRLENSRRQLIVLRSNTYFCNHSSESYEMQYLSLASEQRKSIKSPIIKLRPNERISLPLSLLMGMTEFYARPVNHEHWIVKTSLNNDVLTSAEAMKELDAHEAKRESKKKERRGGTIVYGDTADTCATVIKRLTPNMIVRRWHLRSYFDWELALLPPFVVRNSLPYELEYRFIEYKTSSMKDMKADYAKVEALLRRESAPEPSERVLSGVVESGHDTEVSGISGVHPGYLSVRLISRKKNTGKHAASSWSKPLLMMIHKGVEQFTTSREEIEADIGLRFNIDRITLPSHPRLVRFSSPYWIVNNTSLAFAFALIEPSANRTSFKAMDVCAPFSYPVMTSIQHNRMSLKPLINLNRRPEAWGTLGKMPEVAYKSSTVSKHAIAHAEWSEPINTTAINTMGEIVCGPSVFSVQMEGLYGLFEPGVSLTLSPRYFVQNRLNQKLYIQSFASQENDARKVDEMFQRRSLEDVKQLHLALENGQTTPLYHFGPLKKGESVQHSQRYVSFSFTKDWNTDASKKNWSFAIPINTAGDLYLQIFSSVRQRHIICQASVQVVDMYVYVILTDVSCAPPYRIENYTPFRVDCAQLGESSIFSGGHKEVAATIKPGAWHAFAWFNPLSKERHVELRLSHVDSPKTQTKKYDIDYVGYLDSITMWVSRDGEKKHPVELIAQVVVETSTRVLKITEKELELGLIESQDPDGEGDLKQRRMLYASSFDIRFDGFGFSVLDGWPQEVFFASVDVIQVRKAPASLEWTFSVLHCQVDNMLATAKFPVIMNPVNAGYSDKSVGKAPEPFLKLVLDADLEARFGTYKLLEFTLSDLAVKVDIDYMVNLVKLLEPYLTSDATVAHRSKVTLERALDRRAPQMPIMTVTGDGGIQTDLVYFDVLRISSLSVELEYSITRKDIVASTGEGHSIIFGFLSQIIGLIGSNLSGSPTFSFSEIVILRCFTTKQRLQNQLIANYVQQGVMQAYRLIGSADIIGNPIGLVEDLGSGVVEFLKITKGELTGDAQTRGEGVKMLGKTIVKSSASSVAKITGSLDKFVGEFADENRATNTDGSNSSADNAGIKFAKDFGRGLTGIFTKPVEGAIKGGVTGLVQGTVQGITGPGVVLLKGLTATSHTLALGVKSTVVDRSPFGGRRRNPKLVQNGKVIAEFDEEHYRPALLELEVLGANGLDSDKSCDPLCVVRINGVDVMKTAVIYNTVNPVWQEKTQVVLTGEESEVQFVVKDSYGGTVAKTVGKCIISMSKLLDDFKPPKYSSDLAQWVHTQVKPGDTTKNRSHVITEKEYPLVMPRKYSAKNSNHGTTFADEKHQVFVTILSLRDMVVTSSTGSGMLGLGNLGSSMPNISPYISVHVGKSANRTNTTKMTFTKNQKNDLVGHASWNESFTFSVTAKELHRSGADSRLVVSLKDKSMIVDVRLGSATLDIDATRINTTETEEELVLIDQNGKLIGYLTVKIRVAGSATSSRSLSINSLMSAGDDIANLPPDAVKAGTIRVSCDFK